MAAPAPPRNPFQYKVSVHGQEEIDAVVEVLESSLVIGRRVEEFERRVAELLGKRFGIMVNSGSSALQLAVDLLQLPEGSEVITPVTTFSTTVAPLVRNRLVPAFVDVEPDTFCADLDAIEAMVGDRTRAILVPNLAGNVPDWDRIRTIADRRGLLVVEDTCDTVGATLRGRPTGQRSDLSCTSFAFGHVLNCAGNGGLLALDDEAWRDRGLVLRRWGRSSELQMFGSRRGEKRGFVDEVDGVEYDSFFVFQDVGYNFEPSEIDAAFGLVQLSRLPGFLAARRANAARHREFLGKYPDRFLLPRELEEVETAWLVFPFLVRPDAGFTRRDLRLHLEARGMAPRMVWSGNLLRHPGFRNAPARTSPRGYPNADRVMEHGIAILCGPGLTPENIDTVHEAIAEFVARY
jgi:CDP-6-deoxy-D-xylo-4-hexulose-3-dehydrase